ncbi:MAG: DUF6391 domain-containing protein [Anaerolineae bacterium]
MLAKLLHRIRRNHALEHATITLLSRKHAGAQIMGLSGLRGFVLFTDLTAEEVYPMVKEALRRLKRGQTALAIHPNCGTNLVTAATLTTAVTAFALRSPREKWGERLERLLQLVLVNALVLTLARPLGGWLQARLTVDANLKGVEIASLLTRYQAGMQRIEVQVRHP